MIVGVLDVDPAGQGYQGHRDHGAGQAVVPRVGPDVASGRGDESHPSTVDPAAPHRIGPQDEFVGPAG